MPGGKTKIKAAVVTASDSRHPENDVSGTTLVGLLIGMGAEVAARRIVIDDLEAIQETLFEFAVREDVNLVITTGGTGFSPRDNTPEATQAVIEKAAPGVGEAIRAASMSKTSAAMLSRGIAGIRGNTLIINFPGSPKAVAECFEVVRPVLQHAIDLIDGDPGH
ncbi:MAG: molybdenum cofactor biosynthesis protein B [Pyrinomonadaceae bacterium]